MTMSYENFLTNFIDEPVYLIQENKRPPVEPGPVIIVESQLTDRERQFLHKIFAAVSVPPDSLQIQNRSQNIHAGAPQVFFFGTAPQDELYYQIHQAEGQALIYCHELSEIAADQEKKRQLWGVLQRLYPNPRSL